MIKEILLFKNIEKYTGKRRKDDGVEGPGAHSSQENTKITASRWTAINKKDWNLPKKIFYIQRQRGNHNEMGGGAHSCYNPIPYPPGGRPTNWRIIISQFSHGSEFWVPCQAPQPGGLASGGRAPRAFSFKGQWVLISGAPQDRGKQTLHPWRAHTK